MDQNQNYEVFPECKLKSLLMFSKCTSALNNQKTSLSFKEQRTKFGNPNYILWVFRQGGRQSDNIL